MHIHYIHILFHRFMGTRYTFVSKLLASASVSHVGYDILEWRSFDGRLSIHVDLQSLEKLTTPNQLSSPLQHGYHELWHQFTWWPLQIANSHASHSSCPSPNAHGIIGLHLYGLWRLALCQAVGKRRGTWRGGSTTILSKQFRVSRNRTAKTCTKWFQKHGSKRIPKFDPNCFRRLKRCQKLSVAVQASKPWGSVELAAANGAEIISKLQRTVLWSSLVAKRLCREFETCL